LWVFFVCGFGAGSFRFFFFFFFLQSKILLIVTEKERHCAVALE